MTLRIGGVQVFSLDAAPGIDVGAARRQLQAYLPGPGSFRGQGALAGPLALPPVAHSLPPAGTVRRWARFAIFLAWVVLPCALPSTLLGLLSRVCWQHVHCFSVAGQQLHD